MEQHIEGAIMRRILIGKLSGLILAFVTLAATAAVQAPDQAIRETTDRLRALIERNRATYETDSGRFFREVEAVVVPRFDTHYIGQIILGPHWRTASESQRTRFIAAFKNNLVHSYAHALLEHADTVELKWKPLHMAPSATDTTVGVELIRKGGPPIPISFSTHRVGAQWKVYDVSIDGVSLATTFRSQFNPEIKKNGVEGLIQRLETGGKPIEKLS
jgi:phospholipid transport system substrate-binding protein